MQCETYEDDTALEQELMDMKAILDRKKSSK